MKKLLALTAIFALLGTASFAATNNQKIKKHHRHHHRHHHHGKMGAIKHRNANM